MNVDENIFFREATLRICSSLDIVTALKRCFEYIRAFIPTNGMTLHILDPDLNLLKFVASVGLHHVNEGILPLPEKGRDKRAADLQAAFLTNEGKVLILHPDKEAGLPEILEQLAVNANISLMNLILQLEGNRIGTLSLYADGLNQYTGEHARLLQLLHGPIAITMSNALEHQETVRLRDMLADDNRYLNKELRSVSGDEIIGWDFGLRPVMEMVRQVAHLDSPVLLLGETGAGKEVIANAIHYSSPRKDGPFIKVNCGAIPESLLDSELFGHEKGAFTGAVAQRRGRFERADKGTIFLDEIGELPLQAQVKLLYILQKKEIERVGGTSSIPVDIRIISATHRNLEEMIASGRFREDLWFRLNVFPITIPPLRQRKEDIRALVHHFIERKTRELKLKEKPVLGHGAIDRLVAYDWPGNVRELENMIERALIRHQGGALFFETLLPVSHSGASKPIQDSGRNRDLPNLDEMTVQHIRQALEMAGGTINGPGGAAQILGLHPNTLRNRMNKLGITYGRKNRQPL